MERLDLRKVAEHEISLLQHISKQTFLETFSESNSEENMKKYLEEGFSVKKLTTELNNPDSEFYFAFHKNAPK